jgi:hypothetical protein
MSSFRPCADAFSALLRVLQHGKTLLGAVQVQQLPQRRRPCRGANGRRQAHPAAQSNRLFSKDSRRWQRRPPGPYSHWRSSAATLVLFGMQSHFFAATLARPWLSLQEERLFEAILRVLSSRRHLWSTLQVHKLVHPSLVQALSKHI